MAGRPPTRQPGRGSWEGGHQDVGHPHGDYSGDDYLGDDYLGDELSGAGRHGAGRHSAGRHSAGYRETGHQHAGYPEAGYGDAGYQNAWYQDPGYRDAGRPYGGRQDGGRQDAGRRARRPDSYAERGGDDRGSWDGRPPESWAGQRLGSWADGDREAWAGDRQGRADAHRGWTRERESWTRERGVPAEEQDAWAGDHDQGGWAGERGAWAGQDRRSWDNDVWDWEDEDPGEHGHRGTGYRRDATGGAEGNERLTALTGTVLLVLFAAEGVTILSVHQLLTLHFFLGMLIVGPVALKACAVLYRFVRYYTGAEEYRRKGPPAPLLRMLGPVVLITSLAVIGTGIMLAVTGPSGLGTWLFLHRASFVLWFGAMTIHVLAYVWRLPRLVSGDLASRAGRRAHEVLAGRPARWLLLTASILMGLLLAMLTVHRAGLWFVVH